MYNGECPFGVPALLFNKYEYYKYYILSFNCSVKQYIYKFTLFNFNNLFFPNLMHHIIHFNPTKFTIAILHPLPSPYCESPNHGEY